MTTRWALSPSVVRTARKDHDCHKQMRYDRSIREGWDDGVEPCPFGGVIRRGQTYIEYLGETAAFQSGKRYHVGCADLHDARPVWHRQSCPLPFVTQSYTEATDACCGGEPAPYEPVEIP